MKACCLGVAIALVACQQAKSEGGGGGRGDVGHERGDCRPDKSCDSNLLCLSNVCVKPPGADCTPIAENLTSYELGNYAEPEARAPVVAKYKAQCEQLAVTKDEGACLDKAHDKWAAAQCVPRMFPGLASSGDNGRCAAIAQKVSGIIAKQMGNNPQLKGWAAITIRVTQQSCEEDHWPDALKQCALAADLSQSGMGMDACAKDMPPEATQKLQQRMTKAMQDWQANGGG